MFRRVLVPVDFTPKAMRAARAAARVVADGGEVVLLHVIERLHGDLPGIERFYRRLERMARGKARTFTEVFRRRGTAVRVAIVYGDPLEETLRYAGAFRADLIVMGSHRFSRSSPGRGWGTLSYKIGLLSSKPVLLIK
jgi:nucleotide-binding universal stress UspA family protein